MTRLACLKYVTLIQDLEKWHFCGSQELTMDIGRLRQVFWSKAETVK